MPPQARKLVLGSGSRYRKGLLQRLGLDFDISSPDIDETVLPGETPRQLVLRLSEQKALAVGERYPDALIIGSDQCAVLDERILGKPGNFDNAFAHLRGAAGKTVGFQTGLCLLDSASGERQIDVIEYRVTFRDLDDDEITRYLKREEPYDSAGSFKAEGLGIALFEKMEGEDPNALIGLPLIRLVSMLARFGVDVI